MQNKAFDKPTVLSCADIVLLKAFSRFISSKMNDMFLEEDLLKFLKKCESQMMQANIHTSKYSCIVEQQLIEYIVMGFCKKFSMFEYSQIKYELLAQLRNHIDVDLSKEFNEIKFLLINTDIDEMESLKNFMFLHHTQSFVEQMYKRELLELGKNDDFHAMFKKD